MGSEAESHLLVSGRQHRKTLRGSGAKFQPPTLFVNFAVKFYALASKVVQFSAYFIASTESPKVRKMEYINLVYEDIHAFTMMGLFLSVKCARDNDRKMKDS